MLEGLRRIPGADSRVPRLRRTGAALASDPTRLEECAAPMTVTKVWIEEGCIACNLCQDLVPEVFLVKDGEPCVIKPEAAQHFATRSDDIREAAADCPVEVIKLTE